MRSATRTDLAIVLFLTAITLFSGLKVVVKVVLKVQEKARKIKKRLGARRRLKSELKAVDFSYSTVSQSDDNVSLLQPDDM
jgi:hypothetical protein